VIALILSLCEAIFGGAVVCAEAGGEHIGEQVIVAEVIRTRSISAGVRPFVELTRRGAWAHPCSAERLEASHVLAYLDGVSGGGPGWNATAFYASRLHPRLEDQWKARGWRVVEFTEAHVYWKGAL
jgi:hypothetical protein